ncbi:HpcH/HpaI aldolase/citrate lyase family protein [Paraburkholderia sp.]|uniref:HpcH/HpaI aldolase/citrate lyase family protein n=1 Tax=Paraburkholderia sp. TaxID=1926495 RepID=UPI0039E4F716
MEWPIRSSIFIPAHKSEWVHKIARYRPDAVVLDLEDAVAPHNKPAARLGVPDLLSVLHRNEIGTVVRINALEEGGELDLDAIVREDLDAVLLPKAATVAQVRELDTLLAYYEGRAGIKHGSVAILILPETAVGMQDARLLAQESPRVRGLVCGILGSGAAGDFAGALGIWPSESALEQTYIGSKLSLDSRAAGAMHPIAVVNGVKIEDLDKVSELTQRAKICGYTGVLVIHPTHLPIVQEAFAPTDKEVMFYQGIIDTMEKTDATGDGAVRYEGEMIDYAMLARAREVLRDAARFEKIKASRAASTQ